MVSQMSKTLIAVIIVVFFAVIVLGFVLLIAIALLRMLNQHPN